MTISPLVSVVIPNFKRVTELKDCIQSVLEQTYKNIEILVVDDCSPNIIEIENMLKSINDNRITLFKQKKNKGGGAARNKGIIEAEGKYIALLDSDDSWTEDNIQMKVELAEKDYFDEDILIYNQSIVKSKTKSRIGPKREKGKNELISEYIFVNGGTIYTPTIFINASLAKKCLFNESYPRHQDMDFIFKIERQGAKFIFIKKILTIVNWSKGINPINKGWSPEFSIRFLKENYDLMTEKSFAYAYFSLVIRATGQFVSKKKSLLLFFKNFKSMIAYIDKKILLIYLVKLFLDWRYINAKVI